MVQGSLWQGSIFCPCRPSRQGVAGEGDGKGVPGPPLGSFRTFDFQERGLFGLLRFFSHKI